jgi:hypothetical protein
MTSYSPINSIGFFIPDNISFAKDFDQFLVQFTPLYQNMARSTNSKDIGQYELEEIICGQRFFGANPQTKRTVYRKCFNFGAIGVGAALNIPHGITNLVAVTRLYGTAITAFPDDRPIPFVSVIAVNQGIQITGNGADIIILNGAAAPAIVSGFIIAEYIKQ